MKTNSIILRIPEGLHDLARKAAAQRQCSLNTLVLLSLDAMLLPPGAPPSVEIRPKSVSKDKFASRSVLSRQPPGTFK